MSVSEDKELEKEWKEARQKAEAGDEKRKELSSQFYTAVLRLSKQKDRETIVQLRNLKSSFHSQPAESVVSRQEGHLSADEKRIEKEIEKLMELQSLHSSDAGSAKESCDLCGFRSTEALADCCFRVGFIQLAIGVLTACVHILLSFTNEDGELGLADDDDKSTPAQSGNVIEAVAYTITTTAGISIICAVCLRKKWLAGLHFGLCLASPLLFLSVITIIAQYGTTFGLHKKVVDPLWVTLQAVQFVLQFVFATFSWRLMTSMEAIILDDNDEDQLLFDNIERDEDALFRKRKPKV